MTAPNHGLNVVLEQYTILEARETGGGGERVASTRRDCRLTGARRRATLVAEYSAGPDMHGWSTRGPAACPQADRGCRTLCNELHGGREAASGSPESGSVRPGWWGGESHT